MIKMKKHTSAKFVYSALLAATIILSLLFMNACKKEQPAQGNESAKNKGTCTVVVDNGDGNGAKEYTVNLDGVDMGKGLQSLLDILKNEQGLIYKGTVSGYGLYLTQVNDIKEDLTVGVAVCIWTSVEKDFDTSRYVTTKEYNGKTLKSSGVGASWMTVEDGAVIYIGKATIN